MKKTLIIIAILAITGAVAGVGLRGKTPLGSVQVANEYNATSTASLPDGHRLIKTGPATLGSLVIASSSGAIIKVWNATSTTDTASSTFVTLKANAGEGTYTFDVILNRGLVVEMGTGSNGSGAVTWR